MPGRTTTLRIANAGGYWGDDPYALRRQVLGEIPIDPRVAACGDTGDPIVHKHPDTPVSSFEDELADSQHSGEELKLVDLLIEATRGKPFAFGEYADLYTKRLTTLIEAKVEGQELVAPPSDEPQQVINLMEALKKSLSERQAAPKKPPVRAVAPVAESSAKKARKTGTR